MLRETPLYLRLNPADDVVIACRELEGGTDTGTNTLAATLAMRDEWRRQQDARHDRGGRSDEHSSTRESRA